MFEKWYNMSECNDGVIISCRVRLARNLKNYNFSRKLEEDKALCMIDEIKGDLIGNKFFENSNIIELAKDEKNEADSMPLVERHILSNEFVCKNNARAAIYSADESHCIMINEEDHIRIQTIFPGESLDKAYDLADNLDNLIDEHHEYVFDKDYGFLTSCPTNIGTGLRASFMLHLPLLEITNQIPNVVYGLSKFGLTIRGIYGEGTEPLGSIYQISNQITLGKSENEIMQSLINLTKNIISQENSLREKMLNTRDYDLEDKIYRSLGILTHARKISRNEAMKLLSNIRLGLLSGKLDISIPNKSIYSLMIDIQSASIQKIAGYAMNELERDLFRAEYIRTCLTSCF